MKKLIAFAAAAVMTLSCGAFSPAAESFITVGAEYSTASSVSISSCTAALSTTLYTYTGTAKKPVVRIKSGSKTLIRNTDYTLTYSNNINVGTASVTIKGKGKYSGTKKLTYKIKAVRTAGGVKAAATSSSRIKVSWSAVACADGYYVQKYNSSNGKYESIGKTTGTSYTVAGLNTNSSYKFRVCTYRRIPTGTYKTYSAVVSAKTMTKSQYYQNRVLELVNVQRKKYGLNSLKADAVLTSVASKRAVQIVSQFEHNYNGVTAGDMLDSANYEWWSWGENIAYGQTTPEEVVTAWMNSEGHRRNILSSNFGRLGVGCYFKGTTPYWVQVFSD